MKNLISALEPGENILSGKNWKPLKSAEHIMYFEQDLLEFIKDNEAYTWRKKGAYPFDGWIL